MPCESCAIQFSVFRRKRACSECERYYCSNCLRRGGGMCAACRVLSTRPLSRHSIAHLKVRDLQCFLQRQNISTRGCVEKEELVSLCVSHVNSASYRRRGVRGAAGAFSSLKGFTSNLNELINSAFDLRPPPQPAPTAEQQQHDCFNTAHVHSQRRSDVAPDLPPRDQFTTRPGGEQDIVVEVPPPRSSSSDSSPASARMESADCFEIEDLDDAGWEVVARPADPLPEDSSVLMSNIQEAEREGGSAASPARASSELNLLRSDSTATNDTASLQDEPMMDNAPESSATEASAEAEAVSLEGVCSEQQLEALSVRQLKELLARNRVATRGCVERNDLLERARTLYLDHRKYRQDIDNLPLEECCKICMSAPLECVLLECGHIAACTGCAKQLAECPICRQYVVRAVRCFRS